MLSVLLEWLVNHLNTRNEKNIMGIYWFSFVILVVLTLKPLVLPPICRIRDTINLQAYRSNANVATASCSTATTFVSLPGIDKKNGAGKRIEKKVKRCQATNMFIYSGD